MKRLLPLLILAGLPAGCGGGAPCTPGQRTCDGNLVRVCNPDGHGGAAVEECGTGMECRDGECVHGIAFGDNGTSDPGGGDRDLPPIDPGRDLALPDPGPQDAGLTDPDLPDPGLPDPGLPDPGLPDPGAPDAGTEDRWEPPPDEGSEDPGLPDPGPADEGPADPGVPDPGPVDVAPADPGAAPRCGDGIRNPGEECDGKDLGGQTCASLEFGTLTGVPGCRDDCTWDTLPCGGHTLTYAPVKNLLVTGGFVDVAWHPSGAYALLVGRGGQVAKYDATTGGLSSVGSTGSTIPTQVAFAPSGVAYVVGYAAGAGGHVFRVPDGAAAVEAVPGGDSSQARWQAIEFPREGGSAVLVGQANSAQYYNIGYLATWDPAEETLKGFTGYNTDAGVTDFTFVDDPTLTEATGYAGLITCGANGRGANLWLETGTVISGNTNASYNGLGNMGRAKWRPRGKYGLVCGTSSSSVYLFTGVWASYSTTSIPDFPSGSGVHDVFFRADGNRALIVGASSVGVARIVDHRPKGDTFSVADRVYQPINGWNDAPWLADNAALNAGGFRPRVSCDQGLIVGEGPGPSYSPGFGKVVFFRDSDPHDCAEP